MKKTFLLLLIVIMSILLVGCHEHKYNDYVYEATCTENGYTKHTCLCGDSYIDNIIEAKGHEYFEIVVEPTCDEPGYTKYTCKCGDSYTDKEVEAHGHNYFSVVVEPTCTEKGYTEYKCYNCTNSYKNNETEAKGHSYGEWIITKEPTETTKGTKQKQCSDCNDVVTEIIPEKNHKHNYVSNVVEPTCTEEGYTELKCDCGDSYIENITSAKGHSYSDWIITKQPTETEKGTKQKECSRCGDIITESIPEKNHEHEYTKETVSPTCDKEGYTLYTCKCGDNYKEDIVSALGHSYGEWVITKEPTTEEVGTKVKECSKCNSKITEEIDKLEYLETPVTLNGNGAALDLSYEAESKITITDYLTYDSLNGKKVALYTTPSATYWYYIPIKQIDNSNIYEIQQVVYLSKNVSAEYDYLIMWHNAISDSAAQEVLMNIYNNADSYIGKFIKLDNLPSESGDADISMEVLQKTGVIDILNATYKEPCDFPEVKKTGYIFKGWLCSIDNQLYTKYPGYGVAYDNVTFTAQWELISMSDNEKLTSTYQTILSYFESIDIVNEDLNLSQFNNLNETIITYTSSDESMLSNTGVYNRPYKSSKVTFEVNITSGSEIISFTHEFTLEPYKELKNIASSYVYTNYNKVNDAFFDTMDVIYCAFVLIDTDGGFTGSDAYKTSINRTNNSALNNMKNYIFPKANKEGCWVIASIGGGGDSIDATFEEICNSEEKMDALAANCVKLINEYGFDGIDIDWEIPDTGTKFTKLAKKIYDAVKANNPNHIVTAAIGGGKWQPPKYDLTNSRSYLDYVNVMTYNMVTGSGIHHSALYSSRNYFDSTNKVAYTMASCSIKESVDIYNNTYGIASNKLIVGAAFYGIRQTRSSTSDSWTYKGSVSYTSIVNDYLSSSDYDYYYDTNSQAPYLLSKDRLTFVSYDDPRSIKAKCDYILSDGLAGIMYWQNGQDTTGDLVSAIKEGLNK